MPTSRHSSRPTVGDAAAPVERIDGGSAALPGEPHGFTFLYDAWFADVGRWLRALGAPETELDDLTQEVFTVVLRKFDRFDGRHPAAWLYQIARRTWSDHRRRTWFRNMVWRRGELPELRGEVRDAEERLVDEQRRRQFWRLVARLGEHQRTALVLFEIEGYSGERIAELQAVPLATVWTRLHHGRKRLAALLAAENEEE